MSLFKMFATDDMIKFVDMLDSFNNPLFFLFWGIVAVLYGKGKIRYGGDTIFFTMLGTYVLKAIYEVSK
ncbi:MAG: hypothetical protein ACRC92_25935 [Peptostreptococcaceae bacterium]